MCRHDAPFPGANTGTKAGSAGASLGEPSSCYKWCRRPGSNRYGPFGPWDFKSQASAYSATPARVTIVQFIREVKKKVIGNQLGSQ